jgi:hypothetical protein
MQSVPLISFWYNNILRSVMGKVLTTTGDILDSAMEHAQQLKLQSRDIQQLGHQVAVDNISKLDEYKSDLKEIYLKGVKESE